ncbi:carboxypeptidase-like regulatory domain-containing protein [candidate division KSB1 bacterium]|nr:carboxypeptidase-like regulatory domain-containing protein [candidate division KSB1 bacterium]
MRRFARDGIFVLHLLWAGIVHAQSMLSATLSGQVRDAASNGPLASVNVFLANTMLGCQTDAQGLFEIRNVPFGTHDLVVSLLGYEVQRLEVRITSEHVTIPLFRLLSKPLQGPEVEVVAEEAEAWRKDLRKFEEFFWGRSKFVAHCKILNPEVLDFAHDENHWFTATASEPLQIANRALGYRIHLILTNFEYHERRNEIRYSLIPHFEPLQPENPAQEQLWRRNRLKAYRGSMRHFLHALAAQRTNEEGFEIYTLPTLPWQQHTKRHLLTKPERLLAPGELPTERRLSFEDYLEIVFAGDREKTSWMTTSSQAVVMNIAGYVYSGRDLFVYGSWFHQRLAEALPREYAPPEE